MVEREQRPKKEPNHKWRTQDGFTPKYKAFIQVYITDDLGPKNDELKNFINENTSRLEYSHVNPITRLLGYNYYRGW